MVDHDPPIGMRCVIPHRIAVSPSCSIEEPFQRTTQSNRGNSVVKLSSRFLCVSHNPVSGAGVGSGRRSKLAACPKSRPRASDSLMNDKISCSSAQVPSSDQVITLRSSRSRIDRPTDRPTDRQNPPGRSTRQPFELIGFSFLGRTVACFVRRRVRPSVRPACLPAGLPLDQSIDS